MLTTLEKVLFLHEVPLLAPVPTDALVHLGHVAEEVHWTDGEAIWRHGDAADALYFVIAGEVVLEEEPRGYPNAKVGPASDLGTSALIGAAGRRDRTARAVIPTAALRVGRHEFFEVLSEHPELAFSLLDALGSRLEGDQVQRLDTEPWPADVHPL